MLPGYFLQDPCNYSILNGKLRLIRETKWHDVINRLVTLLKPYSSLPIRIKLHCHSVTTPLWILKPFFVWLDPMSYEYWTRASAPIDQIWTFIQKLSTQFIGFKWTPCFRLCFICPFVSSVILMPLTFSKVCRIFYESLAYLSLECFLLWSLYRATSFTCNFSVSSQVTCSYQSEISKIVLTCTFSALTAAWVHLNW